MVILPNKKDASVVVPGDGGRQLIAVTAPLSKGSLPSSKEGGSAGRPKLGLRKRTEDFVSDRWEAGAHGLRSITP